MFTLICARINGWVNYREAGDLRRYRGHYDVTVMWRIYVSVNWITNGSCDGLTKKHFHSPKCNWKCRLWHDGHFVHASMGQSFPSLNRVYNWANGIIAWNVFHYVISNFLISVSISTDFIASSNSVAWNTSPQQIHSGETDEANCSWLHPVWPPPKRPGRDSTFCVVNRASTELIFCIHRDFDVRNSVYKPCRLVCDCCRDISAWKSRVMKPTVLRDEAICWGALA